MANRYNQSSSTEPNPGQTGATELATTGSPVSGAAAAPPSTGQVITATSATTYSWQTPGGGAANFDLIATAEDFSVVVDESGNVAVAE